MNTSTHIEMTDEPSLREQFKNEVIIKTDEGSVLGKIGTAIAAIIIVFSVYYMTPYILNFLSSQKTQVTVIQSPVTKPLSAKHLEAYLWTAKLKLEDLKLNHRLKISLSDGNELKIDGSISKNELPNWNDFQTWYATKEGFPKLTHSVSTTATVGDIPELKSVWFDATPTAYFVDGRSGNIGTVLNDGWKIISIEAWAVFVERNGTTITLNY